MLLESFFESYGLIIILLVAFALIMVYYFLRSKKFQQTESDFQNALKPGDKVKTYSGFYGTVEKITDTTDGKVVSLRLGENSVIDVDIRALMGIDMKEEIVEKPAEEAAQEVAPAEANEEQAEQPEKVAEQAEEAKKPAKREKKNRE